MGFRALILSFIWVNAQTPVTHKQKKNPTHIQAHLILFVPLKIKRAFSFRSLSKKYYKNKFLSQIFITFGTKK